MTLLQEGSATATSGTDDIAIAIGSGADANGGTDDIAAVFDPFGTVGSSALAGDGNFDLAAVFGDMLTANAFPGDDMITILPMLF